MTNEIRISRRALDEIAAHAREAAPAECCGVLIGMRSEVLEASRTHNLAANPNRFELDPKGHLDARRDARGRGLEVVGFYHSHPHSEPTPSPTDLAEATYPDYLHLIVRPLPTEETIRAFRHEGASFVEVGFRVVEQETPTRL